MEAPAPFLAGRVEALLHKKASGWRRVQRGYTPAGRWVVRFEDGSSAFLKAGDDEVRAGAAHTTAEGLRREHRVYSQLQAPFIPRLLAFSDGPGATLLVLEDLSGASWPPPWTGKSIAAVLASLEALHSARLGDGRAAEDNIAEDLEPTGWPRVSQDPLPFLGLRLASAHWLETNLPALLGAAEDATITGDDLCHWDVRSDNLCLAGETAVLIDWNWAASGNGRLDLAFWLPSLEAEGGPPPEEILDAPELAAVVSGFFAARAGLPPIPALPGLRGVQLDQLRTALPWAVRALGLTPLDGDGPATMTPGS
jgi:hypothetical protein